MADETTVRTSTVTWKEECEKHDLSEEDKTVYIFSNGRKFEEDRDPYNTGE